MDDHRRTSKFVGIPSKTLLSKEWSELSPVTRCVYLTLLLRLHREGNPDNLVTWTLKELTEAAGVSHNSVPRSLAVLKKRGWLIVWAISNRWGPGTTYSLTASMAVW